MHNAETKDRFIELRAQSWSLARISAELNIPISTLSAWNIRYRPDIHQLKVSQWEDIEDRLQCSHDTRLEFLLQTYKQVEAGLAKRLENVQYCGVKELMQMAASLRAEIFTLESKVGRFHYYPPSDPKPEISGNSQNESS